MIRPSRGWGDVDSTPQRSVRDDDPWPPKARQPKPSAEPCPACAALIYRRIVLTNVIVLFDTRLEYDGMYYYHRRHRCQKR